MALRTKLFLFVGVLLLLISVAVYLIPSYFGFKKVAEVKQEASDWLERVAEEQAKVDLEWLQDAMFGLEAGIDASLYLALETPSIREGLMSDDPTKRWGALANLMTTSGHLDFAQVGHSDGSSELIAMGVARLYPIIELDAGDGILWVAADEEGMGPYIGVSVRTAPTGFPTGCFLFPPEELLAMPLDMVQLMQLKVMGVKAESVQRTAKQLEQVQQVLRAAQKLADEGKGPTINEVIEESFARSREAFSELPEASLLGNLKEGYQKSSPYVGLVAQWGQPIPRRSQAESLDIFSWRVIQSVQRLDALSILNGLGNALSAGALGEDRTKINLAAGVAKAFDDKKVGVAILSQDLVSLEPLFDGAAHYKAHPPQFGHLGFASALDLMPNSTLHEVSVVNTALLGEDPTSGMGTYLTVGTSIGFLTWEFALHKSSTVLAVYDGAVVSGFGPDGGMVPPAVIDDWNEIIDSAPKSGDQIEIKGESYTIWLFEPDPEFPVTFYVFESDVTSQKLVNWITDESQRVIRSSSRHLFMVSFGLFLIGLIILHFISRRVTRPLTHLAEATELVGQGKYEAVDLPEGDISSHNEVSRLGEAFRLMVKGLIDKERIRAVLNKCVSKEIADQILSRDIKLAGEVRDVAVLFVDIRNFTGMTERMDPEEVISMLNEYMSWVSDIIESHRGVIDKYIGDAAMGLYGAPVGFEHCELQAVATAILLMERLKVWNGERSELGRETIQVGIGVHHGPMVAGNMGGELRQNYTVLGANVNMAARLCSRAKGGEILISDPVYQIDEVKQHIEVEDRGKMEFKGFSEPVQVYRVIAFRDREALERLGIRTTIE